jgi:hypothetical protein
MSFSYLISPTVRAALVGGPDESLHGLKIEGGLVRRKQCDNVSVELDFTFVCQCVEYMLQKISFPHQF